MKTSDRILETARALFNAEGDANVTAAEIAQEMDISPGNLYYHYKGKDSIHLALFARMQRELIGLLSAPITEPGLLDEVPDAKPLERSWLFLTVVLESMLKYRYLYENPNDLMHRYPEIDRGFRRLVRLKRAACKAIAWELISTQGTSNPPFPLDRLVDAMTLALTYWLSYDRLAYPDDEDDIVIHRGVLQLLSFCAPYLGEDQAEFYGECQQLYAHMTL